MMLVAATVVQVGRIRAKKARTDAQKHKRILIFYSIGILIIFGAILMANRPWIR